MSLVPTVCGAVKFLQENSRTSIKTAQRNLNTDVLKREGMKMAKAVLRRDLSRRVLEVTSTGNFRLKMISERTASDLLERLYHEPKPRKINKKVASYKLSKPTKVKNTKQITVINKRKTRYKQPSLNRKTGNKNPKNNFGNKNKKNVEKRKKRKATRSMCELSELKLGNDNERPTSKKSSRKSKLQKDKVPDNAKSISDINLERVKTPPLKMRLRNKEQIIVPIEVNQEDR